MDRLKEIREKYYTPDHNGLKGDFSNEEVKEIQQASYNLGRDEVIDERIATYVSMRDKYAGVDDSMAYAYDTVVNDLLNMQLLKENKK